LKGAFEIKLDYDFVYKKWKKSTSMYKEDIAEMVRAIRNNKGRVE